MTPMARAVWKLEEARFFLGKMAELPMEPTAFRYFLSAFLAAARSVTDLFNKNAKAWYVEWRSKQSKDESELITEMADHRNEEVHGGGAALTRVSGSLKGRGLSEISASGPPLAALLSGVFGEKYVEDLFASAEADDFFFEGVAGTAEEARTRCRRYLVVLDRLVAEHAKVTAALKSASESGRMVVPSLGPVASPPWREGTLWPSRRSRSPTSCGLCTTRSSSSSL